MFFGFVSFFMLPVIFKATCATVVRCKYCGEVMEVQNPFEMKALKSNVLNFVINVNFRFSVLDVEVV